MPAAVLGGDSRPWLIKLHNSKVELFVELLLLYYYYCTIVISIIVVVLD